MLLFLKPLTNIKGQINANLDEKFAIINYNHSGFFHNALKDNLNVTNAVRIKLFVLHRLCILHSSHVLRERSSGV